MISFQQDISRTISAAARPGNLFGMMSKLPDRHDMIVTVLTGP